MEAILEKENTLNYEVKNEDIVSLKEKMDEGTEPLSVRDMSLYIYSVIDSAETNIFQRLQEPAPTDESLYTQPLKNTLAELLEKGEKLNENYALLKLNEKYTEEGVESDKTYLSKVGKILAGRIQNLEESEFPEEFVETRRKHAEVLRKTIENVKQRIENI
jgi:hypothetical protein